MAVLQGTTRRLYVTSCTVTQDPGATILATRHSGALRRRDPSPRDLRPPTRHLDVSGGPPRCRTHQPGAVRNPRRGHDLARRQLLSNQGTIPVNSDDTGTNAVTARGERHRPCQGAGTLRLVAFSNQNDAAITTASGVALTQARGTDSRSGQIRRAVVNEGLISAG